MGLYQRYILPKLINAACGTKPIDYQRRKVVPLASGKVLEIGIGSGLNIPHYEADNIQSIVGIDTSPQLQEIAKAKAQESGLSVDLQLTDAESLKQKSDSFDTVLVTYSLCTIDDPEKALNEMFRVLKPGGQLVFCEHGKAPDANIYKWQRRIEPIWKLIAGGCHLSRDIPNMLNGAGFNSLSLEQMYLPSTPKIAGYNYWGTAHKN